MKIEHTNGELTEILMVDDVAFKHISAIKKQGVKNGIIGYLNQRMIEEDDLQDLITWVVERYGKTEQVGDCIYTSTMEIKNRKPYRLGVKDYLSQFDVNETKEYNGDLAWDSLRSVATRMGMRYGVMFHFETQDDGKRFITRVR